MKSDISIVVPVYNVEAYLAECLESLINQTYDKIKIICVNDGSTDGSGKILERYAKLDKRIVVVSEKNGGLSRARNRGLTMCDTKYVMFCDSDDAFDPTMCEKMLSAIERDKSDIAACGTLVSYDVHGEMKKSDDMYYGLRYRGCRVVTDEVILNTDVSVSDKIFRMELIKEKKIIFPEGLNNEDFYFYNVYMSFAKRISFVNEKLYYYKRRAGSIMSGNLAEDAFSLDHLEIAKKLFDTYRQSGFLDKHRDLFWRQWRNSYWFSFEHTAPSMRGFVFREGKNFVKRHLKEYPPEDGVLRKDIGGIFGGRLARKIKKVASSAYAKVNVGYRQQRYINYKIERLKERYGELSQRLDELAKKGAKDGKIGQ